jgi:hypothetical protein
LSSEVQASPASVTAAMMRSPPMVGVPALDWWLAGPSSRMYWPNFSFCSQRMSGGASSQVKSIAVITAIAARKEM